MKKLLLLLLLGVCGLSSSWVWAQQDLKQDLNIAYLELKKDPRYGKKRVYARYLSQPLGRPYAGAEVALQEAKFVGAAIGVEFRLQRVAVNDVQGLAAAVDELNGQGVHYFILDVPAAMLAQLAEATRGRELLLLNIAAREDELRQEQCQAHMLHIMPNDAMLSDALVQYLVWRKWRKVLLLQGPLEADKRLTAVFERSAKRYGLKIVDKRPFVLSNDPRQRDRNNVALLTGGDYDVLFVADSDGEFAREVPYQTLKPRPVVGSEGLAAVAWHWSWERHGAPQLEKRFEKRAMRPMTSWDWAAWMGIKAIVEAVLRTDGGDFEAVRDYLRGREIILDGFKGNRLSFRSWDNQLRQPLLLATHNWVVERAPLKGFLHASNNLDALGFDQRDSRCRF